MSNESDPTSVEIDDERAEIDEAMEQIARVEAALRPKPDTEQSADAEALADLSATFRDFLRSEGVTASSYCATVLTTFVAPWLAARVSDARRDGGVAALTEAADALLAAEPLREKRLSFQQRHTDAHMLRDRASRLARGDS